MQPGDHADIVNDIGRDFLTGRFRREIGLESLDLRFGLDVAKNSIQRGAFAEALRTYVALVLMEPMNVDFQVGLANCALLIEENYLALQAASVVVAISPEDPRGYFLSARACLALGHFAEAEEDFREAMKAGEAARDATMVDEAAALLAKMSALNSGPAQLSAMSA